MPIATPQIDSSRDPAHHGYSITPDDNTQIRTTRALWIGTGGTTLSVVFANDTAVTLFDGDGIPSGIILPFAVKKVMATGTTCTNIVGLN